MVAFSGLASGQRDDLGRAVMMSNENDEGLDTGRLIGRFLKRHQYLPNYQALLYNKELFPQSRRVNTGRPEWT